MIPRHLAIIFAVLVLASLVMAGVLFHTLENAHKQMLTGEDSAPTKAPAVAAPVNASLLVASDDDNSLRSQVYSLPLPADPESRARAVLGKLLDLYAAAGSSHPVPGGAASVEQVFLLPAQSASGASKPAGAPRATDSGPQMAVINLKGSFVAGHPSGLETETLTVLSICGTLSANLPRVTRVRFLVDGEQHESLAGHADLTRTYLTSDIAPADSGIPAESVRP
ncbi:MAG TPA: GerMN domain-containing protein [Terracidiphilus sp.]|nr:GerMN domain-containing protein [Terracidiphilus sp.]